MTDKACGFCVKRHVLVVAGGGERLECRARPPAVDVAMFGRFPTVRPTDYCHGDFEPDASAQADAVEASAASDRLDSLTASTAASARLLSLDGVAVIPPSGDLATDLAAPHAIIGDGSGTVLPLIEEGGEVRLALAEAPSKRARRARAAPLDRLL